MASSAKTVDPITASCWECVLPVRCWLDPQACRGEAVGRHCYFKIPRQGYLFLNLEVMQKEFSRQLHDLQKQPIWFDCVIPTKDSAAATSLGSIPSHPPGPNQPRMILPWHLPMGVIMDILRSKTKDVDDVYSALPLDVTIHVGQRHCHDDHCEDPSSTVLPKPEELESMLACPYGSLQLFTLEKIERQGMTMIKQYIKTCTAMLCGSTKPFFSLSPTDDKQLVGAILNNDPRCFLAWKEILNKACDSYVAKQRQAESKETKAGDVVEAVKVPFSFHCADRMTTKVISSDAFPTIGLVMRHFFPCCYDLTFFECREAKVCPSDKATLLVSGAQPCLCTPIEFFGSHLISPDNFVHVVVIPGQSNEPRERPAEHVKGNVGALSSSPQVASEVDWEQSVHNPNTRRLMTKLKTVMALTGGKLSFSSNPSSPNDEPESTQSFGQESTSPLSPAEGTTAKEAALAAREKEVQEKIAAIETREEELSRVQAQLVKNKEKLDSRNKEIEAKENAANEKHEGDAGAKHEPTAHVSDEQTLNQEENRNSTDIPQTDASDGSTQPTQVPSDEAPQSIEGVDPNLAATSSSVVIDQTSI